MRISGLFAALLFSAAIAPAVASTQGTNLTVAQASQPSSQQVQTAVKNAIAAAGLSMRQKMKIKPMIEQYQQQTANADAATKKSAKEELLKNIYGVMTPDQQAKFKASLKSSMGSMQQ
ncbi:MAG TPA: hypothetical protein VHX17_00800 [Candidatus Cybelea sp.]|jgi:hypothetical protein|nr:hypothetical protein [Candidatus Cybelea sp.]